MTVEEYEDNIVKILNERRNLTHVIDPLVIECLSYNRLKLKL